MLSIVNIPFPVRARWGWCSVKYSLWLGIHSSKDWYLFLVQIFLNVCPTSTDSEVVTLERRWLLACYVLQGPQMMQKRSSVVPAAPWKEHRVKEGHAPWGCQGAAGEWSTVGSVPQMGRRKHSCLPNGDIIDWRSPGESKHHLTESAQTPETTSSVTSNRQNQNRAWDNSPYPPWGKCMGRCLRKHLQRSSSSCSQSRSPSFPTPSKNRHVLVHT